MKSLTTRTSFLLALLVFGANVVLAGEPNDIANAVSNLMHQVRNKEQPRSYISDAQLKLSDPQQVLGTLALYEKDPVWTVRQMAYLYEVRLARLHPTPEVRQEVTKRLVEVLVEPNSGLSRHPYKWLLSFTEKDFNDESRAMLRQALAKDRPRKRVVRICGVANIQEELPRLKGLLIDELKYQSDTGEKWYYTAGWHARLARARMGVEEDIEKCIELVDKEENATRRVLTLLHDVGYISQPAAIEYLQRYLESDERVSSVRPGTPGSTYSQFAMDILATSLKNYPVKRREGRGYKQEEIELCRKWMAEQTKWEIIR